MKLTIIPDWRDAWKWFSVHALVILAALPLVWAGLPSDLKSHLPPSLEVWALCLVALGGLAGRFIDQPKAVPVAVPSVPPAEQPK